MNVRVALTMRVTDAADYDEPRDSISHDWLRRLDEWEMTPLLIPNLADNVTDYLDDLKPDVLVLTGGDDLGVTPRRDETEACLLDHALTTGLPVLGVCRGLQLINTHFGGCLISLEGHAGSAHPISVAEPWHQFYGRTVTVNSYHDRGVAADGLGAGLIVAATDDAGHVEAFRHPEKPLQAVMWHPERKGGPEGDRRLLATLAEKGRGRR